MTAETFVVVESADWTSATGFWVAVAAALIGLASLGFVVFDRIARRRGINAPLLSVDVLANIDDGADFRAHRLRLSNVGASPLWITASQLVGASVIVLGGVNGNSLIPRIIPPFSTHDFDIETPDIEQTWVFLSWMSTSDARRTVIEWMPVAFTGPLREEYDRAFQELLRQRRARFRWLRWKAQPVIPVGPGSSLRQEVRNRGRRAELHLRAATKLVPQQPVMPIHR